MITYTDNSIIILDQENKQMLGACCGTGIALEMCWVHVGDTDLLLSLSSVGLTVW